MNFIKVIELIKVKSPFKLSNSYPLPTFFNKGFFILKILTKDGLIGFGEPNMYFKDEKIIKKDFEKLKFILKLKKRNLSYYLIKNQSNHFINPALNSALQQALWDIYGKYLNKPVSNILSKKSTGSIKCYSSAGMFFNGEDPYSYLHEAKKAIKNNFYGYKFRPYSMRSNLNHFQRLNNPPKINIKSIVKICNILTSELANKLDFKLMLDFGCRLNKNLFLSIINNIDYKRFYFFEEPFPRNQIGKYKVITNNPDYKIAGGEDLTDHKNYKRYKNKYYFYQPDTNLFSIDRLLKLDKILTDNRLILHNWFSEINNCSNVHLAASLKNCDLIEYRTIEDPYRDDLYVNIIRPKNGILSINKMSGLGIKLNEKKLKKFIEYKLKLNIN